MENNNQINSENLTFFTPDLQSNNSEIEKSPISDGPRFAKLKTDGVYVFRVLPPWNEEKKIGMKIFQQWNIPWDNGSTTMFIDPEQTFPYLGITNPIMEEVRKFKKIGLNMDDYEPQVLGCMNVIFSQVPPQSNLKTGVIYILQVNNYSFDWIIRKNFDPNFGDLAHPLKGYPIYIERKNENGRVSYDRQVLLDRRGPLANSESEIRQILERIPNLTEIFRVPDEEYKQQMTKAADLLRRLLEVQVKTVSSVGPTSLQQNSQNSKRYWVFTPSKEVKVLTDNEIKQFILMGVDKNNIKVMSEDQSSGWQEISFFKELNDFIFPPQIPPKPTLPEQPKVPSSPSIPEQPKVPSSPSVPEQPKVINNTVEQKSESIPVGPQAPSPSAISQNVNTNAKINIPPGAPTCFGDKNVYDYTKIQCKGCVFQFECKEQIGKI